VNYLNGTNIEISMTENGDPYENAIAERVNGILKHEYGLVDTFDDYLTTNEAVKIAVHKYNNLRPHASCNYLVPAVAHKHQGVFEKRWKPWKKPIADDALETQS